MLHQLVRIYLEAELKGLPPPSLVELGAAHLTENETKYLAFVTLYRDGEVIASSGRIHNTQLSTLAECLANARTALTDSRAIGQVTLETLASISVRVDVMSPTDRRVLANIDDCSARNEGLILLSQNHAAAAVVLPGMAGVDATPEILLAVVCKKAGIPVDTPTSHYVLYAMTSTIYSDF
jgi:AMMECR1 domain-containing protein